MPAETTTAIITTFPDGTKTDFFKAAADVYFAYPEARDLDKRSRLLGQLLFKRRWPFRPSYLPKQWYNEEDKRQALAIELNAPWGNIESYKIDDIIRLAAQLAGNHINLQPSPAKHIPVILLYLAHEAAQHLGDSVKEIETLYQLGLLYAFNHGVLNPQGRTEVIIWICLSMDALVENKALKDNETIQRHKRELCSLTISQWQKHVENQAPNSFKKRLALQEASFKAIDKLALIANDSYTLHTAGVSKRIIALSMSDWLLSNHTQKSDEMRRLAMENLVDALAGTDTPQDEPVTEGVEGLAGKEEKSALSAGGTRKQPAILSQNKSKPITQEDIIQHIIRLCFFAVNYRSEGGKTKGKPYTSDYIDTLSQILQDRRFKQFHPLIALAYNDCIVLSQESHPPSTDQATYPITSREYLNLAKILQDRELYGSLHLHALTPHQKRFHVIKEPDLVWRLAQYYNLAISHAAEDHMLTTDEFEEACIGLVQAHRIALRIRHKHADQIYNFLLDAAIKYPACPCAAYLALITSQLQTKRAPVSEKQRQAEEAYQEACKTEDDRRVLVKSYQLLHTAYRIPQLETEYQIRGTTDPFAALECAFCAHHFLPSTRENPEAKRVNQEEYIYPAFNQCLEKNIQPERILELYRKVMGVGFNQIKLESDLIDLVLECLRLNQSLQDGENKKSYEDQYILILLTLASRHIPGYERLTAEGLKEKFFSVRERVANEYNGISPALCTAWRNLANHPESAASYITLAENYFSSASRSDVPGHTCAHHIADMLIEWIRSGDYDHILFGDTDTDKNTVATDRQAAYWLTYKLYSNPRYGLGKDKKPLAMHWLLMAATQKGQAAIVSNIRDTLTQRLNIQLSRAYESAAEELSSLSFAISEDIFSTPTPSFCRSSNRLNDGIFAIDRLANEISATMPRLSTALFKWIAEYDPAELPTEDERTLVFFDKIQNQARDICLTGQIDFAPIDEPTEKSIVETLRNAVTDSHRLMLWQAVNQHEISHTCIPLLKLARSYTKEDPHVAVALYERIAQDTQSDLYFRLTAIRALAKIYFHGAGKIKRNIPLALTHLNDAFELANAEEKAKLRCQHRYSIQKQAIQYTAMLASQILHPKTMEHIDRLSDSHSGQYSHDAIASMLDHAIMSIEILNKILELDTSSEWNQLKQQYERLRAEHLRPNRDEQAASKPASIIDTETIKGEFFNVEPYLSLIQSCYQRNNDVPISPIIHQVHDLLMRQILGADEPDQRAVDSLISIYHTLGDIQTVHRWAGARDRLQAGGRDKDQAIFDLYRYYRNHAAASAYFRVLQDYVTSHPILYYHSQPFTELPNLDKKEAAAGAGASESTSLEEKYLLAAADLEDDTLPMQHTRLEAIATESEADTTRKHAEWKQSDKKPKPYLLIYQVSYSLEVPSYPEDEDEERRLIRNFETRNDTNGKIFLYKKDQPDNQRWYICVRHPNGKCTRGYIDKIASLQDQGRPLLEACTRTHELDIERVDYRNYLTKQITQRLELTKNAQPIIKIAGQRNDGSLFYGDIREKPEYGDVYSQLVQHTADGINLDERMNQWLLSEIRRIENRRPQDFLARLQANIQSMESHPPSVLMAARYIINEYFRPRLWNTAQLTEDEYREKHALLGSILNGNDFLTGEPGKIRIVLTKLRGIMLGEGYGPAHVHEAKICFLEFYNMLIAFCMQDKIVIYNDYGNPFHVKKDPKIKGIEQGMLFNELHFGQLEKLTSDSNSDIPTRDAARVTMRRLLDFHDTTPAQNQFFETMIVQYKRRLSVSTTRQVRGESSKEEDRKPAGNRGGDTEEEQSAKLRIPGFYATLITGDYSPTRTNRQIVSELHLDAQNLTLTQDVIVWLINRLDEAPRDTPTCTLLVSTLKDYLNHTEFRSGTRYYGKLDKPHEVFRNIIRAIQSVQPKWALQSADDYCEHYYHNLRHGRYNAIIDNLEDLCDYDGPDEVNIGTEDEPSSKKETASPTQQTQINDHAKAIVEIINKMLDHKNNIKSKYWFDFLTRRSEYQAFLAERRELQEKLAEFNRQHDGLGYLLRYIAIKHKDDSAAIFTEIKQLRSSADAVNKAQAAKFEPIIQQLQSRIAIHDKLGAFRHRMFTPEPELQEKQRDIEHTIQQLSDHDQEALLRYAKQNAHPKIAKKLQRFISGPIPPGKEKIPIEGRESHASGITINLP